MIYLFISENEEGEIIPKFQSILLFFRKALFMYHQVSAILYRLYQNVSEGMQLTTPMPKTTTTIMSFTNTLEKVLTN